jgi:uncharacterized protein (TIGR02757 family)
MNFTMTNAELQRLKIILDSKVEQYNVSTFFIDTDPIQLPHRFTTKEDVEIVSLLVSTIAWGNRKSILKSGENILEIMQNEPKKFVENYTSIQLKNSKFVHRTFNAYDLDFLCRGIQHCYQTGGLEESFAVHSVLPGAMGRILSFREKIMQLEHEKRSEKHISNPLSGGAAKRLNMFLRWMVRDDNKGVDFGIWKTISPAELLLPLDVHTANISRQLGILKRDKNDGKALEEIMETLRKLDHKDPVKYDFALFGLGAFPDQSL